MNAISYLSICSGLGGAALALNSEGFHEVASAEIEPFCAALLDHRFGSGRPWRMPDPDAEGLTDDERRERRAAIRAVAHLDPTAIGGNAPPNLGDFTQIRPEELPPVDMLIGGTPCQAFSFAGLRRGLADARGNLTLAFVELAHGLAETNGTRCALWENVPGVLSDDDNAFGCFLGAFVGADDPLLPSARPRSGKGNAHWRLDEEKGWIPRWPSAGMVAGPRARAAWIVRNAQYFGVPQRRERVFLVVDLGGGPDPAAVLFERKGVRGHSGARGKARKDVAGPVKASAARRGGREDNGDGDGTSLISEALDVDENGLPRVVGAICADAHPGAYSGQDAYSGRLIPVPVGEPMPFERWIERTGQLGGTREEYERLVESGDLAEPVMFKPSHYTRDKDGAPATVAPPLSADADKGDQDAVLLAPIAFDTTQITHPANRSVPKPGGPSPTLAKAGHAPAVAFDLRGREGGVQFEGPHDTANLRAASGGSSRSYVAFAQNSRDEVRLQNGDGSISGALAAERAMNQTTYLAEDMGPAWAVRRLLPVECERLQGVPDGHTDIPWRGKDHAPDGPRYRAIGNGWATPVVRWLGRRIAANWPRPAQFDER